MSNCPIFYTDPESTSTCSSTPIDEGCVECCSCGYLQYESLVPYLREIRSSLDDTTEQSVELEFKLREQIIEISRLFDIDAGVSPGFFSKAHYSTTEVFPTNGSKFIKIPDFVKGTLVVRNMSDCILSNDSYGYQDGYLVFKPCEEHLTCGCHSICGNPKTKIPQPWPDKCYKISGRWGKDCADFAVQMAIRDYLIEGYRMKDPVVVAATGLPTNRGFRVPHSWSTYIKNFKDKRALFSQFAFA